MKKIQTLIFLAFFPLVMMADAIDSLQQILTGKTQVQEKVYIHTDNSMYFIGDTLWYKAYVMRSDNLRPTSLSKMLYVELLTPDGYLVERQRLAIDKTGGACGQFVFQDSLYSGFYEIRAYTRWQLNFNVTEREYFKSDREKFFNIEHCKDFFRDWEGLYSRVIPVYGKPMTKGDYTAKYMLKRPTQRVLKEEEKLTVSFFPEGGNLVKGIENRVAFEVTSNSGQALDLKGTLSNGTTIQPVHNGRGFFALTPTDEKVTARFEWNGKNYTFPLPKAQETGVALTYNAEKKTVTIRRNGVTPAAYAVSCRAKNVLFGRLAVGETEITLDATKLRTGVNDIVVYDANGMPLASRLIFVNNNDIGTPLTMQLTADNGLIGEQTGVRPYAKVTVNINGASGTEKPNGCRLSVAVRDSRTDDCGYDDGNIMTEMLLASDLKGFIANPAYYFEKDDAKHRSDLDLLMMVQGWRRYKPTVQYRYLPETNLTYEGTLYKLPDVYGLEKEDLMIRSSEDSLMDASYVPIQLIHNAYFRESNLIDMDSLSKFDVTTLLSNDGYVWAFKPKMANFKKAVVEGEIVKGKEAFGAVAQIDSAGHFRFNIPNYYDEAYLFVKAYNAKDSLKKSMASFADKKRMDEEAFPDYYIKQNTFFPVFTQPYSWYQINSPKLFYMDDEDDELIPENSRLAGNHVLQTVVVKSKKRGRKSIDYSKPAFVIDAYEAYNTLTDCGLSFGMFDMKRFPGYFAECMFGNMGSKKSYNILAKLNDVPFWLNYAPQMGTTFFIPNITADKMFQDLHLRRLDKIKVYTDYDKRNNTGLVDEASTPAVTMVFESLPDGARRPTYRDRRYVFNGIAYAEEFYSPDYSNAVPAEPKDYRRTLYWNPNVKLSEDGTFTDTFFNNSKETRMRVSATGIDAKGQMYY